MFRKFQALKKGIETIKRVAPSVGNKLGQKKVDLLKKMGKTQRKSPENFKKAGGDKLKKEILGAETRVKKFMGGILGKDKKKKKEEKKSKKGTKPKDLIYKPKKMKRLEELRKELKAKGGAVGKKGKKLGRGIAGAARKDKKKRVISSLEKVYGQVADRSRERLRKRGNITIDDIEGKMKKDITEAGKAMGGYKSGGRAFGGGKR